MILDTYPGKIQQGTFSERQCVTVLQLLPHVLLTLHSESWEVCLKKTPGSLSLRGKGLGLFLMME